MRISALALGACALVAVAIGWIVAGRMLAPVRRVTATAAVIVTGNLHERIALGGPDDEVKELADTFDGMLARLQAAFEGHRRFAANASHELLTPLATVQALLDLAANDPEACDVPALLDDLTALNLRSTRIVEALLDLARAEHGATATSTVDLADLARDAIADASGEALRHEVAMVSRLESAPVKGDPTLLRGLVANVVNNAIRHNEPCGRAVITVSADRDRAVLAIGNTGPRVTPDQVQRLLEPFTRAAGRTRSGDHTPGGYGLGLAIVHAVATAHHGTLTVVANPTGGLTVTVDLPLRKPA